MASPWVQSAGAVRCAGTNTGSTRTLFDPLAFMPRVAPSPQSSRTVTCCRGMTAVIRLVVPATIALPMKWVACAIPEQ
jgi:hypothetical protein